MIIYLEKKISEPILVMDKQKLFSSNKSHTLLVKSVKTFSITAKKEPFYCGLSLYVEKKCKGKNQEAVSCSLLMVTISLCCGWLPVISLKFVN